MTPRKSRKPAIPVRARVRRGNVDDAQRLREDLLAAADKLFAEQGLDGVSMRAVAALVGVSAMTPYRYFADKAALLSGLWQRVIHDLCEQMTADARKARGGRARQRAVVESFLRYWEANPDHYRLVYMTELTTRADDDKRLTHIPAYGELLELVRGVTVELAGEIGADTTHVKVAGDVRFAMLLGYLHATLVNHRYPWAEQQKLRTAYVEQVLLSVERCLLDGPGRPRPGPAAPKSRSERAGR